ncbi:phage virion morphogenesis protein [Myxococcota bacterium]|jgi:phage virion morphogenesis protein|nr:phage virion morphogenesis protein [Myxococcota bacterium]
MAGLSIEVRVQGLEQVRARLERLAEVDRRGLARAIGEAIVHETLDAFKRQESPWGERWKPSQRAQGLVRGKKPGLTLVDTARLRNSIHARTSGDQVEVGTDVVYARIHQLGGKAGRGVELPARPYLPADEQGLAPRTQDLVERIVREHLEERLK